MARGGYGYAAITLGPRARRPARTEACNNSSVAVAKKVFALCALRARSANSGGGYR